MHLLLLPHFLGASAAANTFFRCICCYYHIFLGASAAATTFFRCICWCYHIFWVYVGIDLIIPYWKYQLKPHSFQWFSTETVTVIFSSVVENGPWYNFLLNYSFTLLFTRVFSETFIILLVQGPFIFEWLSVLVIIFNVQNISNQIGWEECWP